MRNSDRTPRMALPKLPRRRSRWQHIGRRAASVAGAGAGQLIACSVLAYAAMASADSVPDATWHPAVWMAVIVGGAGVLVAAIRGVEIVRGGRRGRRG